MIRVNGEDSAVAAGTTIAALLEQLEAPDRGVAVAVDGEVVPRAHWDTFELAEDARVEVLSAMQGG